MSQHFKKGSVGAIAIAFIAIVILGVAIWYVNSRDEVLDTTPVVTEEKPVTPVLVTKIKVPLLVDESNANFQGKSRACDKVVLVERTISATSTPLNAVYTELFARKEAWPYSDTVPGNYITSQKDLVYKKVEIVSGVAKVYLTGKKGPINGVCDDPRLQSQMEEAALQFPTVKSVEVYLNNTKLDWNYSQQ